jgi:hypothetical protein
MPYIDPGKREWFDATFFDIDFKIETKGELEYLIFRMMKRYMKDKEKNYTNLHNTVYSAIHCGDEFRRRFLDKREDFARKTNGDIKD